MNFDNLESKLLSLLKEKENTIIAIDGKSGVGKTRIIKNLKNIYGSNMIVCTSEKFVSIIVNALKSETNPISVFKTMEESILVIEDIDCGLIGKQITQRRIAHILQNLLEDYKIIITGIELNKRIPDVINNIEKHLIFLELE